MFRSRSETVQTLWMNELNLAAIWQLQFHVRRYQRKDQHADLRSEHRRVAYIRHAVVGNEIRYFFGFEVQFFTAG